MTPHYLLLTLIIQRRSTASHISSSTKASPRLTHPGRRGPFSAIYTAAEGTARVNGLHGDKVYSDIISPIFFILAMEQLFRTYDKSPAGVSVGNYLQIGVLGYADDAALVSLSPTLMSERLTSVASGSTNEADMTIHKDKAKNMIVARQSKLRCPTVTEIQATEAEYKHECEFCGRRFKTK